MIHAIISAIANHTQPALQSTTSAEVRRCHSHIVGLCGIEAREEVTSIIRRRYAGENGVGRIEQLHRRAIDALARIIQPVAIDVLEHPISSSKRGRGDKAEINGQIRVVIVG